MTEITIISIPLGEDGKPLSHPVIYDISADKKRPITQAEVDRLLGVERAFNKIICTIEEHRKPHRQALNQASMASLSQYIR